MRYVSVQLLLLALLLSMATSCNKSRPVESPVSASQMSHSPDEVSRGIAMVERKGGTVALDDYGEPVSVFVSDRKFSTAELEQLAVFTHLRELTFFDCKVNDSVWPHLRGMSNLEELKLRRADITDEGMMNLRHLPKLKLLDVNSTSVGNPGLAHVAQLKSLETLDLLGTEISGAGLVHVGDLHNLKDLTLVQTVVDDNGLRHIRRLSNLQALWLEGTHITNAGLVHVGQLTNLRELSIHNNDGVNEKCLVHLERLDKLETFYLCVPVTEVGLKSLKKLTNLKHLYIGDGIDETRELLEAELPNVGVY